MTATKTKNLTVALAAVILIALAWLAKGNADAGNHLYAGVLILLAVAFYFVPAFIAWNARKRDLTAIAVLNLLAGWTFIGWVIALIWALKKDAPAAEVAQ